MTARNADANPNAPAAAPNAPDASATPNPDDNLTALLALHKLYAEMDNAASARRDSANKFYLTLAAGPIALIVFASRGYENILSDPRALLVCGAVGSVAALIWSLNLYSYRKLSRAKQRVIEDIEARLPHAGFTKERDLLQADRYQGIAGIEAMLPTLMMIAYAGLTGYAALAMIR